MSLLLALQGGEPIDVTADAGVLSSAFSQPAIIVSADANIATPVLSAAFSQPAATASADASVSPAVLAATFSQPATSVAADANTSPAVISATFSQPEATVSGDALVAPAALSATFTLPAPHITTGGEVDVTVDMGCLELTAEILEATATATSAPPPSVDLGGILWQRRTPPARDEKLPRVHAEAFVLPLRMSLSALPVAVDAEIDQAWVEDQEFEWAGVLEAAGAF